VEECGYGALFIELVFGGENKRIDAAKLAVLRVADRRLDGAGTLGVRRLPQHTEKRFVVAFAHRALLTKCALKV
jgi:hypothetical protein